MAKKKITVEVIGEITQERISNYIKDVTLAYTLMAQDKLSSNKPPRVEPGTMVWASEKQRKFVMRAISREEMKIPYVRGRGNGMEGSKELNNSFRRDVVGNEVILYSSAPYSKYVIGAMQYWMHAGRWKTGVQVVEELREDGSLDYVAKKAMENF